MQYVHISKEIEKTSKLNGEFASLLCYSRNFLGGIGSIVCDKNLSRFLKRIKLAITNIDIINTIITMIAVGTPI